MLVLDKPDLCLSAWQDAIPYDVRWEVQVYNFHVGIRCKKLTFEEDVPRVERVLIRTLTGVVRVLQRHSLRRKNVAVS